MSWLQRLGPTKLVVAVVVGMGGGSKTEGIAPAGVVFANAGTY